MVLLPPLQPRRRRAAVPVSASGQPGAVMSRPVAAADAGLVALCCEFGTIDTLLQDIDAGRVEIDDAGLASATERYWVVARAIAGTPAQTERGRRAKVRAALVATRFHDEISPRRVVVVRSALADLISQWEESGPSSRTDQS